MYYSILPVMPSVEIIEYVELSYNGCDILAVVTDEGYKIERLYSCDYTKFMDETFAPGTLLNSKLID
ncbi:YlzJ-like family protein [Candidatus Epulonipiscium viviparus]|uniref:YlzJ-like family protein n=1 Tax=Candidatus Epulonipiscium viviparus TaxID=420336 RepID=UPI00273810DF|nr:YlzJ-like family protein [Candidatus Epulopiscium viviparus]